MSARRTAGDHPALAAWTHSPGVPVLDVIYLAVTVALFAIVGLTARGAAKLDGDAVAPARLTAPRGEEQG